jgi:IS5 family transposase
MQQQTFAEVTFERYRKATRRERFLNEMTRVVPWAELAAAIESVYPKAEGPGRPPVGVERMLRIHFLQHWFNLSDPAVEEALYDSRAMRQFVGIDLGREPVPDETTICKFRHLLEAHQLGEQLFTLIRTYLAEQGLQISRGTIVDATIISAPSSTKNRTKERDPEMHQTKKGNQWYFGMKAHIGVDSRTKLIHSVAATAANVHDAGLG